MQVFRRREISQIYTAYLTQVVNFHRIKYNISTRPARQIPEQLHKNVTVQVKRHHVTAAQLA